MKFVSVSGGRTRRNVKLIQAGACLPVFFGDVKLALLVVCLAPGAARRIRMCQPLLEQMIGQDHPIR